MPIRLVHNDRTGPFVYADRGGKIAVRRDSFDMATYAKAFAG